MIRLLLVNWMFIRYVSLSLEVRLSADYNLLKYFSFKKERASDCDKSSGGQSEFYNAQI